MYSWPLSSATPRAYRRPSRISGWNGGAYHSSSGSGGWTSKWPNHRTVGALSASYEARTSPTASGCPSQSTSSHSPPASRTRSHTHSPACWTSGRRAGSALTDSIRRNSASSWNQSGVTASVDLGHERLLLDRRPDVGLVHARRQIDRGRRHVLVVDLREQVRDAVQPCAALVIGLHDPPRGRLDVGVTEHLVLGPGVLDPAGARLEVHRAQLPAAHRIVDARLEAAVLLRVGDREPVLDELDPRARQHVLEVGTRAHELLVLALGAEAHHPFDAGAVVPGSVEQHHLTSGREVLDVALEVPLASLALGRRRQRDDAAHPRVRALGDALDHAALPRGVAPLEDHDDLQSLGAHVLLHDHELALELQQLLLEPDAVQLLALRCVLVARLVGGGWRALLRLGLSHDFSPSCAHAKSMSGCARVAIGLAARRPGINRPANTHTIRKPVAKMNVS